MVRVMARIECSIGNPGSTVTVKVQFIPQFQRRAVGSGPLSKWRDSWRRLPSLSVRAPGPPKKLGGRGRAKGSRNKLAEKFLDDLYDIPGWGRPMRLILIVVTVGLAMLLELAVSTD